jgi:hypothetical protein
MKAAVALPIVLALADGVNPVTGEAYPEHSPYAEPRCLRALYAAVNALQREAEREARAEAREETRRRIEHGVLACPNCGDPIIGHKATGCTMFAVFGALRDRVGASFGENGDWSEKEWLDRFAKCDANAFWNTIGRLLDDLQDGTYDVEDTK